MHQFTLSITVSPTDLDGLGHVNNVVYLRWMLQAAGAHWESVTTAEQRAAVAWVVIRHEIDYKAPAFAGEQLVVRTRVGEATRATWERLTEVHRVADGRLLAQCRSVYVPLDPGTGRPRRVDRALRAPFEGP